MKKHCFLTLFVERCAKSSKNAFFSHFLRTLYKVSRKTWKYTVFSHLLRNIEQKAQKHCFYTFFANFVQSVSKNVKKTPFSQTFAERHAKSSKTLFFRIFWKLCTKCHEKCGKNTVFSNFLRNVGQKAQKTFFFRIFCELCSYKVSQKCGNTLFSHLSGKHAPHVRLDDDSSSPPLDEHESEFPGAVLSLDDNRSGFEPLELTAVFMAPVPVKVGILSQYILISWYYREGIFVKG